MAPLHPTVVGCSPRPIAKPSEGPQANQLQRLEVPTREETGVYFPAGCLQSPDIAGPGAASRPARARVLRRADEHQQTFVGICAWALMPIWRIAKAGHWLGQHTVTGCGERAD